ncbi:MAG: cysteine desulfurase family protein [bacterium]
MKKIGAFEYWTRLWKNRKRLYFDYASVTPIDPRVQSYMNRMSRLYPANPSSLYKDGVQAKKALEGAREEIAKVLEVHSDEIIFTSGGTEANNLAILGTVYALWSKVERTFSANHSDEVSVTLKPHIVVSAIEHPSILETIKVLEQHGVEVTIVPVEPDGIVSAKKIKSVLRAQTVLVTVMYANNEIGTVQPISEIAKALRSYKKSLGRDNLALPYLHTDACQAVCFLSLRVPSLGVDLMTLDSSKFYGPRSAGVLYVRRGIQLAEQFHGGDQEKGKRAGTEDVAKCAGFARALSITSEEREVEVKRIADLRDDLLNWMLDQIPDLGVNGSLSQRLPNNINVCIPGRDAEFMVLQLDAKGAAVSSVTSCHAQREDSYSQVISSLGDSFGDEDKSQKEYYKQCSRSSLRITLGRFTTKRQVEKFKSILAKVFCK